MHELDPTPAETPVGKLPAGQGTQWDSAAAPRVVECLPLGHPMQASESVFPVSVEYRPRGQAVHRAAPVNAYCPAMHSSHAPVSTALPSACMDAFPAVHAVQASLCIRASSAKGRFEVAHSISDSNPSRFVSASAIALVSTCVAIEPGPHARQSDPAAEPELRVFHRPGAHAAHTRVGHPVGAISPAAVPPRH